LKYLLSKTKFNIVKREGCTAILTSEIEEGSNRLSRFGVEEFVADGVISLEYLECATGDGCMCLIKSLLEYSIDCIITVVPEFQLFCRNFKKFCR
ncbi:MAG: hypothetical protein DRP13_01965, partial [Candidatus Aenigmatarchaeota archaeon]